LEKRGINPLYGVRAFIKSAVFAPDGTGSETLVTVNMPDFALGEPKVSWPHKVSAEFSVDKQFLIPKGLIQGKDKIDISIDFEGRNGSWRQVIHGVSKQVPSGLTWTEETAVTRNGKVLFRQIDPGFQSDGYKWMFH
jgi:hypothetical protein